jgi:molecular chaperone GrpE
MSKHERKNDEAEDEIKIDTKDKKEESRSLEGDAAAEAEGTSEPEACEETIAGLQERLKEADDKYLRLAAEFDNFRKRTARQFEELSQAGRIHVITQLLGVLDNFQRALEAAANTSNHDSLLEGMQLVYKSFYDILSREGLEPIEAVGKPFDPNLHDALMQLESDEYAEGTVVREMVKGYKFGDKILRHARVAVSKSPADEGISETENAD